MHTPVVVRAQDLVKVYASGTRALDGLDLEVRRGEVFGFLGPNGAGKSTTIRVLLDLLRPTSGTVEVLGRTPRAGAAALRSRIGYLPGDLKVASAHRTAGGLLAHLARLRGGAGAERIPALAERFGLALDREMRHLSKGNRQKVGVVQAFMHSPDLLILDEPTSGLDPLLQHEFLALVRESAAAGATVLMSSHVLSEVETVAERVGIINRGRMVDASDMATLRRRAGQRVRLVFAAPVDPAEFAALPHLKDLVVDGATLTCLLHGSPDALLKVAARHEVRHWRAEDRELEEMFLDAYRAGTATEAHRG